MALKINSSNDLEYGSAANGRQAGSGYDCQIKRESATTALVNVTTPSGSEDWLMALGDRHG